MNRDEYLEKKQSGELVEDAALHSEEAGHIDIQPIEEEQETSVDEIEQEETEEPENDVETSVVDSEDGEASDLPELSEREKTAFEKRMEREKKKLEESLKQEYEQQYGKHKRVVDLLGGDPDVLEQTIRENQIASEANRLAEINGWDELQTQYYINQQKQERELKQLRVQMKINELKTNPSYLGIDRMEREILSKIDQTNGALSVEEAYWALGGQKRAEQIKLEAQMREIEKRKKQSRTVITDSQTPSTAEKPLPSDVLRDAELMGISVQEARRLMKNEPAQSIDEYRKRKANAK